METRTLDAVEIDRYPIHDLDGVQDCALVERCRAELVELGA